ncbi:MAG: alpha-E domain-containing protein [Gammaproteobacteria bacterium]|nr:alpha-E domain-containing protein [Gammaproteobacteria bacterium]
MLSRVGERLYWMARYIERAENTARLVHVYTDTMLDLPKGVGLYWGQLLEITGNDSAFGKNHQRAGQGRILKFILSAEANPGSLLTSLREARENARTTRDQMPNEAWEHVNELFLFARKRLARPVSRIRLLEFLSEVVMRCQQIAGLLAGTMSHGYGYQFVRLGRNLERADMTTRILDIGSATLLAQDGEVERLENRLWINILRSLSAYQMYRQNVRRRIRREDVIGYLLRDMQFPRAVAHTLGAIQTCLELLPQNETTLRAVARLQRVLAQAQIPELAREGLRDFMDTLQLEFGRLDGLIADTWFAPDIHEAV